MGAKRAEFCWIGTSEPGHQGESRVVRRDASCKLQERDAKIYGNLSVYVARQCHQLVC